MIISFDNQVSLGQSLSASGVAYISGAPNTVLAFEQAGAAMTGLLVNLTVNGASIRVDRAYNGTLFGVVSADRSSSIFTCATATAVQTVTFNGFEAVTPEVRRLASLGYL